MEDFFVIFVFVCVVEVNSFVVVVVQFGMMFLGVSWVVFWLEVWFGVCLLFCFICLLWLIEDGVVFYVCCKEIFVDFNEVIEVLGEVSCELVGKLCVGLLLGVGCVVLILCLVEFEKCYFGICLELLMSYQFGDFNGEGIDCVICVGQLEDFSYIVYKIGYLCNVVFVLLEYFECYGVFISIDDFKQYCCINYVYFNGKLWQWQFDVLGGQIEVDVDVYLLINDGELVIQVVSEGLGIIQVLYLLVLCLLSKGMLQLVMIDVCFIGKLVWIVYLQKCYLLVCVCVFIGWVCELFDVLNELDVLKCLLILVIVLIEFLCCVFDVLVVVVQLLVGISISKVMFSVM